MNIITSDKVNLLRQHARSVIRELGLLNDAYFDIGVTLAERHLLIELSTTTYPTIGEIAQLLLLDKSTASRLIAKAVKKGYIQNTQDAYDKRKRYLELTELGRNVLNAFEPIAFEQTRAALATLTQEEIETVYQGVASYARGLKNARLRNKITFSRLETQDYPAIAHLLASSKTHKKLFETYQTSRCAYLVMKFETAVVGGAGLCPDPIEPQHCRLENICLKSHVQDFGGQKLLLNACMLQAKSAGYQCLYVDVTDPLCISEDVLEEAGFELVTNQNKRRMVWKIC